MHRYIHLGTLEKAIQWMMLVCLVRQIMISHNAAVIDVHVNKGQVVTHRQYPGINLLKGLQETKLMAFES